MSEVVSKKLKFKGDKPKKKKRSHKEVEGGSEGIDDLAVLAAADPRGWTFPDEVSEINGPSFIILPTEPLSCLAWDQQRQRVYAAPLDIPEAPEGANDLSTSEIISSIEPSSVNHVWVVSRLSGSEDVMSLRTSSGTFLTATPSGNLTATTPSRGPLEAFTPLLTKSSSSLFPICSIRTQSEKYLSASTSGDKIELRADAEDVDEKERVYIKCQREFVYKAKLAAAEARGETSGSKKRVFDNGPDAGSIEDEMAKNREAQTWGAGKTIISDKDRKGLKKARKEGKLAEAMLDRRAALKSDRYAK